MRLALLLAACGVELLAQIGVPGQYPGPGRGGSGVPSGIPGIPGRGRRSGTDPTKIQRTYSGVIRGMATTSIDLEASDTRMLTIQITDATNKPADLKTGDGVDVVATQDEKGMYIAVSIAANPEIAKTIQSKDQLEPLPQQAGQPQQEELRTGPPPTVLVRQDQRYGPDEAPPKLKRGVPEHVAEKRKEEAAAPPRTEVATARPPAVETAAKPNPRMEFVEKAREVAASYLEGLPNYVCSEFTTRYVSETREPDWKVIDVVSAEVVYEDGKERYRNLTINGKPSKKSPEESGAWSTGEFGTILGDIFSPGTGAAFKYVQDDSIARRASYVYDFAVERLRSNWKIQVPGQYVKPAFKGSVWIDKETAHTLRIEMQAREIPEEFPRATVETTVEYDYITLGTPAKFLLPVRAEVLSCQRGSNECEHNVIEFRNYHKFSGESTIKFNEQKQ